MFSRYFSFFLLSLAIVGGFAFQTSAATGKGITIEGTQKPFGNPSAPQGGTFNYNLGAEPATLHPITGTDLYNQNIIALVCDTMANRSPETYDWMPGLAEKIEVSPDGTEFTYHIRKDAKFHDGHALTAEDVKFSFDMIFEPKYEAAHLIPYFEGIAKAELIDAQTVKFTAKEKYFGNMDTLNDMVVLPKHIYSDVDKSKKMNKTVMCSGPYKIEKYDQGQSLTLVRNKEWWGNNVETFKGKYNFERIRMRFVKEEDISLEMLKKGDIDFDGLTPEAYTKKAVGDEWGTSAKDTGKKVIKEKAENLSPKSYGYIGWNLRKELFKDRDTRLALYELMNRTEMNKKFRFDMSLLATGPWYQQSVYADSAIKAVPFDPKNAGELFKKAGWVVSKENGVLEKTIDGKKTPFKFTLNYANKDSEKYWVLFQGDLKKAGVVMDLQLLEWNSFLKNLEDNQFDAVALAWGGGSVDIDPKQIWHSASAVKGGSNRIAYLNPEVDKLIDQGRGELDKKKRIEIFRKVYDKIAHDVPYSFLFNDRFILYAHTARMKMTKPTLKYEVGWNYWWIDTAK
jgi:ABC-type transport system substrate-binding protein